MSKIYWRFSLILVLVSCSSLYAVLPDPPEVRVGYVIGWDLVILNTGDWNLVGQGDPGYAEGAKYYYVRSTVDEDWTALLFYLGDNEWELKVTNGHATRIIDYLAFPWESATKPIKVGDNTSDNIGFGTFMTGMAKRQEDHANDGNAMFPEEVFYPGSFFAPFAIIADSTDARIAWASNWPPYFTV